MKQRTETLSRRAFVQRGSKVTAGVVAGALASSQLLQASPRTQPGEQMRFGLVTYQWGRDWDVPTLIRNCQRAHAYGVELRVEHAHGVEPHLSDRQRAEVRLRFDQSPVELVGMGTNWAFHYPDPARVREEIEGAKAHIRLSHDVGGSGVKVKPNGLPDEVPVEQTIEQIGRALNTLGRYGADFGQEIRVEVHGEATQQLPVMQQIMDVADHPNVAVCWNCNEQDLDGQGLEHNFKLVADRLGRTTHVREFNEGNYPYQQLMNLLVEADYAGWVLMEARTEPPDRVQALLEQQRLFEQLLAKAQSLVQAG